MEAAYNSCKAELQDAKRDKRVYAAFFEDEKRKNIELEKEKAQLSQRLVALESIISKKGKRFRKSRNGYSNNNGSGSARYKYHGVFMSLLHDINKEANLCVTESCFNDTTGYRIRNWTNSAVRVSPQTARKAANFIYLPCGTHAVPICPMKIALDGDFYCLPFENITKYVEHRTKVLLERNGFSFMNPTMKDDCMKFIISDPEVISRHRQSLSEAVSQRKKHAKNCYLKALGYETVCVPVPTKGEDPHQNKRREERKEIRDKFCMIEDGKINIMFWRVAQWEDLRKHDMENRNLFRDMNVANQSANSGGNIDVLFSNQAARLAYQELKGFDVPQSGSDAAGCRDFFILTLARADAWMTTALDYIQLEGKGGKRNNQFADSFHKLLPMALGAIIIEIWNDIKVLAADELRVHIGSSSEDENDPFGNYIRDHTIVLASPNENYLYLAASPNYFKEKVCSWFGDVKDCYIGRYETDGSEFEQITSSMIFDNETGYESEDSSVENAFNN